MPERLWCSLLAPLMPLPPPVQPRAQLPSKSKYLPLPEPLSHLWQCVQPDFEVSDAHSPQQLKQHLRATSHARREYPALQQRYFVGEPVLVVHYPVNAAGAYRLTAPERLDSSAVVSPRLSPFSFFILQ